MYGMLSPTTRGGQFPPLSRTSPCHLSKGRSTLARYNSSPRTALQDCWTARVSSNTCALLSCSRHVHNQNEASKTGAFSLPVFCNWCRTRNAMQMAYCRAYCHLSLWRNLLRHISMQFRSEAVLPVHHMPNQWGLCFDFARLVPPVSFEPRLRREFILSP